MRIIEVATVLSISILGLGAGQNIALDDTSRADAVVVPAVEASFSLEADTAVQPERAITREIATELPMLPPIGVAPVGAFSFSF